VETWGTVVDEIPAVADVAREGPGQGVTACVVVSRVHLSTVLSYTANAVNVSHA
jgi:hypothetical protein